jgi:hypothetical protein
VSGHPADEGDFSCGNRNGLETEQEVCGQFLDALASSVLCGYPKFQALMRMLMVDRQKQSP